MTYTADDFKNARFATHPDGRIASRSALADDMDCVWVTVDSEATDIVSEAEEHIDQYTDRGMVINGWVPVQEPRPLTSDDFPVEAIDRAQDVVDDAPLNVRWNGGNAVATHADPRQVVMDVIAALAGPPARPEGAEDIEAVLAEEYDADGEILSAIEWRHAADFLAERFTITPKEQS